MKNKLDNLVKKYETKDFIKSDPIQFPHRFKDKKDIEIFFTLCYYIEMDDHYFRKGDSIETFSKSKISDHRRICAYRSDPDDIHRFFLLESGPYYRISQEVR